MAKAQDNKKREVQPQTEDQDAGEHTNLEILERLEKAAASKKLILIEVPKDVE
jgi:hypothetical protein